MKEAVLHPGSGWEQREFQSGQAQMTSPITVTGLTAGILELLTQLGEPCRILYVHYFTCSPHRALRCVHVVIILFFFFYTDDETEGRRTEELEPVKIARPMGSRAGLTRAQSMLSDLSCVPRRVLFDPSLGNSGQRNQL